MEDLLTRPARHPAGPPAAPAPEVPGGRRTAPPRGPGSLGGRWAALSGRVQAGSQRVTAWRHFDAVLLVLLAGLSLGLRWRGLWTSYWGDEAIAIGIASHPLGSLPHYLVNDGAPPLYYVMLHYWMQLFGRSGPATHVLSMIAALLAIPAAWWSGNKLFGRKAGRGAAALVATSAYLDYYSSETRMYAWLVLAAILALTCFVLAYQGGGRRYWVAATALMAAVLYLQYYGLYLFAATVIAGSVAALGRRSWPHFKATALYALACGAAFAPWVPQFLYQLQHTGAPWAPHPAVLDFFADSFNALASAGWAAIVVAIAVCVINRPRPATRTNRREWLTRSPIALAVAVPLITLLLAWTVGQFVNSWNPRYLGIAVVPALVPLAGGLSRARWGTLALWGAVVGLACTAVPIVVDRGVTVETSKSDVAYLFSELHPLLRPGALVISSEVTDTPVLALDLGDRYRYATPFGMVPDPLVVDWSNISARLRHADAASNLRPLLGALPIGGQVLLVNPNSWGGGETPETYAGPVEAEAIAANAAVLADPDLQEVVSDGVPQYSNPLYPMTVILFVKIKPAK
ncbi:MAG: glycosyltransferase family 39 protein [Acidimicrobiales bacterium]|jgi:mannosyltransferase